MSCAWILSWRKRMAGERRRAVILCLTAAGSAAVTAESRAASRFWVNSVLNGNWNSTANWSTTPGGAPPASVPGAADIASIQQADASNRNVALNVSSTVIGLNITNTGGGTNTLTQTGSVNLTVNGTEFLGFNNNGRAVHTQDSGITAITDLLDIGLSPGSFGTYNLDGSGTLLVQAGASALVRLGDQGTGTFNQTGGTFTIGTAPAPRRFEIGANNGGNGIYNLSGTSTLTVNGQEFIGYNAIGTGSAAGAFVQTGGTHTVSTLSLGQFNGSSGTYDLSAGGLNVTGAASVGIHVTDSGSSSGSFMHSGGGFTATNLTIGVANTGSTIGAYTLSDTGVVSTASSTVGSIVGSNNDGIVDATFTQTGGTHQTNVLTVGENHDNAAAAVTAAYNLSGNGFLEVLNETVVGFGFGFSAGAVAATIHQTGGIHTTPTMRLGENNGHGGSYVQSGGILNVAGSESLNGEDAVFTQTGGSNTIGTPATGLNSSLGIFGGTYDLSGGALQCHGATFVNGTDAAPGQFNHSGGMHTVGSPGSEGLFTIAPDFGDAGTYNLSGTGSLTVHGKAHIGGAEVFGTVIAGGNGVLNVSGGSMIVTDSLTLWDFGGAALNLSGGTLSVRSFDGAGSRLNWTAGTVNVTDPAGFVLGTAEFLPSVTLDAGKNLIVSALIIENGATLTLDGGGLAYSTALTMAGGTIDGTAALDNTAQINGFGAIAGSGGFTNSGGMIVNSGVLTLSNSGPLVNSSSIELAPGTQFQLTGGDLANTGTINVGGGTIGGTATINNNLGGVIAGRGSISASLSNNAGATLLLETGSLSLAQPVTNAGTIHLAGPASTLWGAAVTNQGLIRGEGLVDNALTNATSGEIRAETGQWITLAAMAAPNDGRIVLQNGWADFTQPLTNAPTGQILGRGLFMFDGAGLANQGNILFSNGITDMLGNVSNDTGNANRGITVSPNAEVTFWDDVTNGSGLFRVSQGSSATFFGTFTGAEISGAGDVYFEADVTRGVAPGVAAFGGNAYLDEPATLHVKLAGAVPGTQHDQFRFGGALSIDGALEITLTGGFEPQVGDSFVLITHQMRSGAFDRVTGMAAGPGQVFRVQYNPNDVTLIVEASAPGDCDGDGDVDLTDYAGFESCLSGPGGAPPPSCDCFDVDGDGDADLLDFAEFQIEFAN